MQMKIGDYLYRYVSFHGFWKYKITAEIKRENAVLYELECESCKHSTLCRLLVKKNTKENSYSFVAMVSGIDEDYGDQEYWHTSSTKGEQYFVTLIDARKAIYQESIAKKKGEIQSCEENYKIKMELLNKSLQELEEHYSNVLDKD